MTEHVLLVTSFYPPPSGACAVRMYYFAKAFRTRGWNVDVLVPIQPIRRESVNKGVFGERIFRLRCPTIPRSLFFDAFSPLIGTLSVTRKMPKTRYDAVIATVPPPDTALIAYNLSLLNRAHKFIVDIRDDVKSVVRDLFSFRGALSSLQVLLSSTGLPPYHDVLKKADLVTTVTDGFAEYYSRILGRGVEIIYNGADFDLFSKNHPQMGESNSKGVIVADLDAPYHGVDAVIRALSILSTKNSRLSLVVVGKGRYKKVYEKLSVELGLEENVKFIGSVPYDKLPDILAQTDFGIVGRPDALNWRLSIPVKTLEYISAGLPVFAFGPEHSELEKFIHNHALGMYIPSDNPEEIASSLKTFTDLKFDGKKISEVARKFDRSFWASKMAWLVEAVADS